MSAPYYSSARGGLGNRITSALFTKACCDKAGWDGPTPLQWELNNHVGLPFEQIFDAPDFRIVRRTPIGSKEVRRPNLWSQHRSQKMLKRIFGHPVVRAASPLLEDAARSLRFSREVLEDTPAIDGPYNAISFRASVKRGHRPVPTPFYTLKGLREQIIEAAAHASRLAETTIIVGDDPKFLESAPDNLLSRDNLRTSADLSGRGGSSLIRAASDMHLLCNAQEIFCLGEASSFRILPRFLGVRMIRHTFL